MTYMLAAAATEHVTPLARDDHFPSIILFFVQQSSLQSFCISYTASVLAMVLTPSAVEEYPSKDPGDRQAGSCT